MAEILHVDDSKFMNELVKGILETIEIQVDHAEDGKQTLKFLETNHPKLILMDMKLPDIDGDILCKRLLENPKTKDIRIILVSGQSPQELKELSFQENVAGFITKPFDNQELISIVQRTLK